MRLTLSVAASAALSVSVTCLAEVIIDQPAAPSGDAASQIFLDPYAAYSCSAFDDFTISGGYDLTALTVYGRDGAGGNSALNIAVTVKFFTNPNLNNAAIATATGTQVGGDLVFDLTGITLNAGTYWIAAQVERPFDGGGQWFWRVADTMNGGQALWQNPGGAFGFGSDPVPLSVLGQTTHDMAFTLEGVPAPGAMALLGLSALVGGRRRRGSAA